MLSTKKKTLHFSEEVGDDSPVWHHVGKDFGLNSIPVSEALVVVVRRDVPVDHSHIH